MKEIKRGDIFFADLGPNVGHEQSGIRPVLILQNDTGNKHSLTVIAAAMTSNTRDFITHQIVKKSETGLAMGSAIELEQIRTLDKRRLWDWIWHLPPAIMEQVEEKLKISLGMGTKEKGGEDVDKLITVNDVTGYIGDDGIAYLSLENVARGLGFTQMKNGYQYIRWETVERYLQEFGFSQQVGKDTYIPENIFYRLAMKASNETAEKFQAKVADEILPAIRKTGFYGSGMSKELQAIFVLDKKQQQFESRLIEIDKKVDNQITISYNQAKEIQFAVAGRIITLLGGKGTPDYKEYKNSYFQQLYHDLKNRLGVPSYRDIRKLDYDAAIAYIKAWLPKADDRSA